MQTGGSMASLGAVGPVACSRMSLLSGTAPGTAGSASARGPSLSQVSSAAPHHSLVLVFFLNIWRTLSIYCVYRSSLLPAVLWAFPENLLRLYQTNLLFIWFLLFIFLVNVIIRDVLILRILVQTVTVDVVCVVTFIVHTSYFFTFLLGRWISGILSTSFCILAIPLIFSFSIIVTGLFRCLICWFVDLIPSLSLAPRRILAFWKKSSILIMCFFLLVYSADDGIFLLFWGELLFHSKLDSLWLFLIFTLLSVCCLIGFLLPFLQFAVTGSIESIFFTSEMTSFVVNHFGDLCPISLLTLWDVL